MSTSRDHLSFWVAGRAAPQGSKKHVGRGRLVEVSKYLKPWRAAVVKAALKAQGPDWVTLDGPLLLIIEFAIQRPDSHPKTIRTYPTSAPDLDKLIRGVGDAMSQSKTIKDDSRIVATLCVEKFVPTDARHAIEGDAAIAGAEVKVIRFNEDMDVHWGSVVKVVEGLALGTVNPEALQQLTV